jgi:hypothetical protein
MREMEGAKKNQKRGRIRYMQRKKERSHKDKDCFRNVWGDF